MKRLLFIFLTCVVSLFCITETAHSKEWPPEIDVYYIKFNYESGYTDDALTIKKNATTNIEVPEWMPSASGRNEKIAYIKNQSSRKIQVMIWMDETGYESMVFSTEHTGTSIGYVNDATVEWDEGENYSNLATITLSGGSVPSSVGKRNFTWTWWVEEVDGEPLAESLEIGDTGAHWYYTVLAAPQSPMSTSWTEVLDYSCDWADGETSISDALEELTYWTHYCEVTYDGTKLYYTPDYTYHLNLTGLLYSLTQPDTVHMDCADFSCFVGVLLNSLGGNCQYNMIDRTTSPYNFDYNYLFPAGWEEKDSSFSTWAFHQFGWYNSKVADASTMIDNDSYPDETPHTWKLPQGNMTQSEFIDKLTEDSDVTSVETGTCTVY